MKTVGVLLLWAALVQGCATSAPPRVIERLPPREVAAPLPPPLPTLSQADLVQLAKQGLSAESLISRLKDSRTRLRLSAGEIVSLKAQGVPLAVLDHVLESDRLATADDCTARLNQHIEESRQAQQQAIQQAELMGWQRCQMNYPMFPAWRPFPYRH